MRYVLAFLIALSATAQAQAQAQAQAPWRVECDTAVRSMTECFAVREVGDRGGIMMYVRRNADRTWLQPLVVLLISNSTPTAYRLDDGQWINWQTGDELASVRLLNGLATGMRLTLAGTENAELTIDVGGVEAAYFQMVSLARDRGFVPQARFPLDPSERAGWFARRQIEEALNVPGSAEFSYFEVFDWGSMGFAVCARFSALNMMGVRGAQRGVIYELREVGYVSDGRTHDVVQVIDDDRDNRSQFQARWRAVCKDT